MIHEGPSGKATRNTESRGSGGLLKLNHFVTTQQLHKVLAYLEEAKGLWLEIYKNLHEERLQLVTHH